MQELDPVLVFAFSDKSHAKEREAWKKFLEMLLPVILEFEASIVASLLEEARVDELDEIVKSQDRTNDLGSCMRNISSQLSVGLGLSREFGLACFLDFSPHTKVHAQRLKSLRTSEEKTLGSWFKKFSELQKDPKFIDLFGTWKERIEMLLESEELFENLKNNSPKSTNNDELVDEINPLQKSA